MAHQVLTIARVSREILYRTPHLAEKIRSARTTVTPRPVPESLGGHQPLIAALRDQIRRLESGHAAELRTLRAENDNLRRQLEPTLGRLLALDDPDRSR